MKNNTSFDKSYNSETKWHFMDANGKILGKFASDVSKILIGKHKAEYSPNVNTGDKVVVLNAKKIAVTGRKLDNKIYHRHTGYPSGVRSENLRDLLERRPTAAVRRAIRGMLPKNKLLKVRMRNLYIYEGSEHPHKAQEGNK
jgi:large subunit ribosomal protein L13